MRRDANFQLLRRGVSKNQCGREIRLTRNCSTTGLLCLVLLLFVVNGLIAAEKPPAGKAGTATVVITPQQPTWMGGYAARDKPSQGTVQELYAKALALEDANGNRLVIVTMDLIGIPRTLRERVELAVGKKYALPRESLLLNASHTHCGPELRVDKANVFGVPAEHIGRVREYAQSLELLLVDLVGAALGQLRPAHWNYTHGRAGFAMNRRTRSAGTFINHPNPDGPVDHDVPVLTVNSPEGKLRAILFGYACHNTTMGFYQYLGDYAGYAQEYLEKSHPGVTALFLMGCGGDQNPYPRSRLELAQQHGRALANGVEAALLAKPRPLDGPVNSAWEEVTLEFEAPPDRAALLKLQDSDNKYDRRRAAHLLAQLDAKGRVHNEYSYPIQVVRLGDQLTLVALAGEAVVDYSLRFKRELDSPIVWVAAYSNDVFGYVPSRRVLEEGGYEGGGAMRYSVLPGPFAPTVEQRIVNKVHQLVNTLRKNVHTE